MDIHVYRLKRRPSKITVSTEFLIRSSEAKAWPVIQVDYCLEVKRKSITHCGANRRVGGMKLILAVRPRKINYHREVKKKLISP